MTKKVICEKVKSGECTDKDCVGRHNKPHIKVKCAGKKDCTQLDYPCHGWIVKCVPCEEEK